MSLRNLDVIIPWGQIAKGGNIWRSTIFRHVQIMQRVLHFMVGCIT